MQTETHGAAVRGVDDDVCAIVVKASETAACETDTDRHRNGPTSNRFGTWVLDVVPYGGDYSYSYRTNSCSPFAPLTPPDTYIGKKTYRHAAGAPPRSVSLAHAYKL